LRILRLGSKKGTDRTRPRSYATPARGRMSTASWATTENRRGALTPFGGADLPAQAGILVCLSRTAQTGMSALPAARLKALSYLYFLPNESQFGRGACLVLLTQKAVWKRCGVYPANGGAPAYVGARQSPTLPLCLCGEGIVEEVLLLCQRWPFPRVNTRKAEGGERSAFSGPPCLCG
jgi:hypothetical protein